MRDFDLSIKTVVHCHSPIIALRVFLALRVVLRDFKTPIFWTVHNTVSAMTIVRKIAVYGAFLLTNKTIFCGQYALSTFALASIFPTKCALAVNGVDVANAQAIRAHTEKTTDRLRSEGDKTVRLIALSKGDDSQKQISRLIRLLQSCSIPSKLVVLGNAPEKVRLLAADDNRILFFGVVSREAALVHFSSSHVFVSTSLWEGLPMGVIEALACGIPALLSDIGPHQEIANAVRDCALFDISDDGAFCEHLSRTLSAFGTETRSAEMKARPLFDVTESFSITSMHQALSNIYGAA